MDHRHEEWRRDQRALDPSRRQGATRRYAGQGWHEGHEGDGGYYRHANEGGRGDRSRPRSDREYRRDNRRYRQGEGYPRNPEPGGFEQMMGSRRPPRDAYYEPAWGFHAGDQAGDGRRRYADQDDWESDYHLEEGRYADMGGPQYGMEAGWQEGHAGHRMQQGASAGWQNNPSPRRGDDFGDADLRRARERQAESALRGERPDHRGRGPKGYERSDERIREDICERLTEDPWIDASEVTVSVKGGVVTLEGSVPERSLKHRVEDLADHCSGVKDVQNRLAVLRPGMQPPGNVTRQ